MAAFTITVADEPLLLFPERALYWIRRSTLIVADLHWGHAEALQSAGISCPSGRMAKDLDCLQKLIARLKPKRLLILGDLIHAPVGITPAIEREIAAWRRSVPCEIELIRGNHDRSLGESLSRWEIADRGYVAAEPPFVFTHVPFPKPEPFNLAGHLHPVVQFRSPTDSIRLACYWFQSKGAILPAFNSMAGGWTIRREPGDRIYGIVDESVVDLEPLALTPRSLTVEAQPSV